MPRLDRYLVAQLLRTFGFFALVLVAVSWLNRSILLFSSLVAQGQSLDQVAQMMILTLPFAVRIVLPLAAFAATLYALNRLSRESELVVMQATGASAWRLARPVALFGLVVSLLLGLLVHVLEPAARGRLDRLKAQIAQDVTSQYLREGVFMHPAAGVTLYIREISPQEELLDIFVADTREAGVEVIYTAERALLVKSEGGPKLLMFDGQAQRMRMEPRHPAAGSSVGSAAGSSGQTPDQGAVARLALTRFTDLAYDLSLAAPKPAPEQGLAEKSTYAIWAQYRAEGSGALFERVQSRIAAPFFALVAVLVGYGALMTAPFSRFGAGRQITLAIVVLTALRALAGPIEDVAEGRPALWLLDYLPTILGLCAVWGMLAYAGRRRRVGALGLDADVEAGLEDAPSSTPPSPAPPAPTKAPIGDPR